MKRVQNPQICHGHSRPIVELAYSPETPDGYFLTSASKDGLPMLRNGANGDWIGTFQGHKGAVWSCRLNSTAMLAATASADFSAKVWDAITGDELHHLEHGHIVRTIQFAHQSSKLVTGGYFQQRLRIYDLQKMDSEPGTVRDVPDKVRCAAWHHNDNLILTSYTDQPGIGVWDTRTSTLVKTLQTGKEVTSIEVVQDGRYITTADGTEVRFWDGDKLEPIKSFSQQYSVESASFCPEKGRFVAGGGDMWAHLHDYETGCELECNRGHHGPVHTIRFAPGGESYASGSEDGTIRIWDTDFAQKIENGDAAAAVTPAANGS